MAPDDDDDDNDDDDAITLTLTHTYRRKEYISTILYTIMLLGNEMYGNFAHSLK